MSRPTVIPTCKIPVTPNPCLCIVTGRIPIDYVFGSTRVGAIRLFLGSFTSSFSLSLASLLLPAALPAVLLGVSGGVVIGTPVTLPEFVAVIPGTLPEIKLGLLTTPGGTVLD